MRFWCPLAQIEFESVLADKLQLGTQRAPPDERLLQGALVDNQTLQLVEEFRRQSVMISTLGVPDFHQLVSDQIA